MKTFNRTLLLAPICMATMLPSSASAENLFLLQLGLFSSQESALAQFSNVQQFHSELLENKRYIVKQSHSISGGSPSWRVLVGPFDNRKNASRNCADLKESGTDCFVVETAAVNVSEFADAGTINKGEAPVLITESADTPSEVTAEASAADASIGDSVARYMPWNWFDGKAVESPTSTAALAPDAASQTAEGTQTDAPTPNTTEATEANPSLYTADTSFSPAESSLRKRRASVVDSNEQRVSNTNILQKSTAEESQPASLPAAEPVLTAQENTPARTVIEPESTPAPVASQEDATPDMAESSTPELLDIEIPEGEVEVAEAIPVPLTDAYNETIAPQTTTTLASPDLKSATPPLLDVKLPSPADAQATPEMDAAEEVTQVENAAPVEGQTPATITEIGTLPDRPSMPSTNTQVVTETPRYEIHAEANPAAIASPVQDYRSSRLLQASVFANDRDAFICLTKVQSTVPAAATLRTRIIKSTIGQAIIRFGPINDTRLEAQMCEVITSCGPDLNCRILTEQKPSHIVIPKSNASSNANQANSVPSSEPVPVDMSPRAPAITYDPLTTKPQDNTPAPAPLADKSVWIQLGTSSSESDAKSRFESLKQQHPALLAKHAPIISNPEQQSLAGNVYRLRIGPFESRHEAQNLCANLSSKGVGCLILSK